MSAPFSRLARPLAAALTLAALGGAPVQAQWWTCPSGQGDFVLEESSNDRVRCRRDAGLDLVPSICPNRDTTQGIGDRCSTPNAPVGVWVPPTCPAAVPTYHVDPGPGVDKCRRSLPAANVAPTRQVN